MKYALLALLARQPAHGYELKQAFDDLFAEVQKPLNAGQIYTTLARLERDGLVQDHHVEQDNRPDKRVYRLTDAGKQTLSDWLDEPVSGTHLKDEFFTKLMLAHSAGIADPCALIERQRREYLHALRNLNEMAARPRIARNQTAILLIKGAALHLKADLEWLDLCEEALS